MSKSHDKIGQGHAAAVARLGLKELSQILPAFPDSIRTQDDPGLWGNATQREVHEQRNSASIESREHQGPQQPKHDHDLSMEMGM